MARAAENPEVSIIRLLSGGPGEYTSGQALSKGLGITRAAVWKHIGNLRAMGYCIEASPSKGYRLLPPRAGKEPFNAVAVMADLKTSLIGRRLFFYDELDSTNVKAFELARSGEAEGVAVISDRQSRGRGRLDRRWVSPPGVNLYTSIILRPKLAPMEAHQLTFLAAVAVAEAVTSVVGALPEVKWPNDVLIGSRKTAGILMEMDSEPDRVNFVVMGIGVNLNMPGDSMPPEIARIATSLSIAAGRPVPRAEFARSLYSSVEKWYKVFQRDGFAAVIGEWKRYFEKEGKPVRVRGLAETIEGICAGVDPTGALLVRTRDGSLRRVLAGDLETAA